MTLILITVEPAKPPELNPGSKQRFRATGTYSDGTIKDISSQVTWNSSDKSIAAITASGEAYGVARVSLPGATLPSDKPVAPPPGGPPSGGARPPPPGTGSSTPLISLTADVMVTATLSGITSAPIALTVIKAPVKALPPLDAFMKGIHFTDWKSYSAATYGLYGTGTEQSLVNLAHTRANWISLLIAGGQETIASTTIFRDSPATASDSELLRVINLAHSLGMRVVLLPGLGVSNDPDHWGWQIGTAFTSETQWQEWFASYREYINHYASFAQEAGVDMLYIGSELGGVTHREDDWRRVIKEVRERFRGPISYDSLGWGFPTSEVKRIKWWDAVDYVAVDVWYPLTDKNNPTLAELKEAWIKRGYLADLENISRQFNRPFIISEIGYQSRDGTNTNPGDFQKFLQAPEDLQEQADGYQAALEVLWGKPWLAGIFWWQWSATSASWPENPYGKPAEEVLKKFYLSQ